MKKAYISLNTTQLKSIFLVVDFKCLIPLHPNGKFTGGLLCLQEVGMGSTDHF